MSNQTLVLIITILCSLGGWYLVLTKYIELKDQFKTLQQRENNPVSIIPPINSAELNSQIPFEFASGHMPGMGPPPLANMPFTIPEELLHDISNKNMSNKPVVTVPMNSQVKPAPAAPAQASALAQEKREICKWASIMHLSGFTIITGIPLLNIIVPTILWMLKKDQHVYLAKQGREIINFQITFTLLQIACLMCGSIFIWLMPNAATSLFDATKTMRVVFATSMHLPFNIFTVVPFLWAGVMILRGSVAAYNGLTFKYPGALPFVFMLANPEPAIAPTPTPAPTTTTASAGLGNITFG